MSKVWVFFGVAIALALLLSACGGGATPTVAPTPAPATPAPTPSAAEEIEEGKAVFTGKGGCMACHTVAGISTSPVGPELSHIGTVAATRQPGMSAEEYIKESITNPKAFVAEGFQPIMPEPTTLSEHDLEHLIAFLLSLK